MPTKRVTIDQFEWKPDGTVEHLPTGSTFKHSGGTGVWTREGNTGSDWQWMEISEVAITQVLPRGRPEVV